MGRQPWQWRQVSNSVPICFNLFFFLNWGSIEQQRSENIWGTRKKSGSPRYASSHVLVSSVPQTFRVYASTKNKPATMKKKRRIHSDVRNVISHVREEPELRVFFRMQEKKEKLHRSDGHCVSFDVYIFSGEAWERWLPCCCLFGDKRSSTLVITTIASSRASS